MQNNKLNKNDLYWYLKEDKCLACKLFSAPLFFIFGGYFSVKNIEAWQQYNAET